MMSVSELVAQLREAHPTAEVFETRPNTVFSARRPEGDPAGAIMFERLPSGQRRETRFDGTSGVLIPFETNEYWPRPSGWFTPQNEDGMGWRN